MLLGPTGMPKMRSCITPGVAAVYVKAVAMDAVRPLRPMHTLSLGGKMAAWVTSAPRASNVKPDAHDPDEQSACMYKT